MNLSGKTISVLLLVSLILIGCHNSVDSTKLNVDQNIPPSENFDASYGFWGPDGNKIYFQHSVDSSYGGQPAPLNELWVLNRNTGKRQKVHSSGVQEANISRNGKWVVFQGSLGLYKMRSDGSGQEPLTGPGSPNPDWKYTVFGNWSPDGSKILFDVNAGVPRGVSIMDSNGANAHVIIPYGVEPRWSPDGRRIIYINWDTTQASGKQRQIYIADSTGNNPQKITDLNHSENLDDPGFSPDGKKIVFTSIGQGFGAEMFIMKADGSDMEQVTEGTGYLRRPEWSPDGEKILFTRIIPIPSGMGYQLKERLYLLDVATHQVTPVFPVKN